jgi:O-antigen/teichoic acid export membrane protein
MALKRNLIANYVGQGWTAIMGLAFVPLYIKLLGIEAYGLIGLFAILQAWLTLLDMGLTPTLSREMARFSGGARNAESLRDLLRSCEVIAVITACLVAVAIFTTSHWLASEWLRAESLPIPVVAEAFAIMGAVTALRFLASLYRSCIVGLQRQVLLNTINVIIATLRGAGALAVLAWISPTIQAFFIWQGLVSLATLGVFVMATYHALPTASRNGQFSLTALSGVSRFAAGMLGTVFLSLLLMQVDKLLLSRLLTLSEYGYYMLASVTAGALNVLCGPITQAWYPRLSELQAAEDSAGLIHTFHQGAQLVAVIMGSAAVTLILYSDTLLLLWTQDTELVARTAWFVSLLALGNLLNGLMRIPHMTQLAFGWTSLSIRINIIAIFFVIPAILWAAPRFGAEGAAWVWIALNTGYVILGARFMFQRILTSQLTRWYIDDIAHPLLGACSAALLLRWVFDTPATAAGQAALLITASITTLAAAAFAAPLVRAQLRRFALERLLFQKASSRASASTISPTLTNEPNPP